MNLISRNVAIALLGLRRQLSTCAILHLVPETKGKLSSINLHMLFNSHRSGPICPLHCLAVCSLKGGFGFPPPSCSRSRSILCRDQNTAHGTFVGLFLEKRSSETVLIDDLRHHPSGREDEHSSPERSDGSSIHPLSVLSAAGSNLAGLYSRCQGAENLGSFTLPECLNEDYVSRQAVS